MTAEDGVTVARGNFRVGATQVAELGKLPLKPGDFSQLEWRCGDLSGRNWHLAPAEVYDFERCRALAEKIRRW